jgi:predicted nuclease with TOPRIM domain
MEPYRDWTEVYQGVFRSPDGLHVYMSDETKERLIAEALELQKQAIELQAEVDRKQAEVREAERENEELRAELKKQWAEIHEMVKKYTKLRQTKDNMEESYKAMEKSYKAPELSIDAEWYIYMRMNANSVSKTFRLLSLKYHPDRVGGSCAKQQRLSELREMASYHL